MTFFVADINEESLLVIGESLKKVFPEAKIILHKDPYTLLSVAFREKPDCFITEANLGNVDGIALAVKVKEQHPNISIAIMSESREYAVQAYRIHAKSYMLKPITPERIKKYLFIG